MSYADELRAKARGARGGFGGSPVDEEAARELIALKAQIFAEELAAAAHAACEKAAEAGGYEAVLDGRDTHQARVDAAERASAESGVPMSQLEGLAIGLSEDDPDTHRALKDLDDRSMAEAWSRAVRSLYDEGLSIGQNPDAGWITMSFRPS